MAGAKRDFLPPKFQKVEIFEYAINGKAQKQISVWVEAEGSSIADLRPYTDVTKFYLFITVPKTYLPDGIDFATYITRDGSYSEFGM